MPSKKTEKKTADKTTKTAATIKTTPKKTEKKVDTKKASASAKKTAPEPKVVYIEKEGVLDAIKNHWQEWGQMALGIIAVAIGIWLLLDIAIGVIMLIVGAILLSEKIKATGKIEEFLDDDDLWFDEDEEEEKEE